MSMSRAQTVMFTKALNLLKMRWKRLCHSSVFQTQWHDLVKLKSIEKQMQLPELNLNSDVTTL
jgi:hypothetical protein